MGEGNLSFAPKKSKDNGKVRTGDLVTPFPPRKAKDNGKIKMGGGFMTFRPRVRLGNLVSSFPVR